MKKNNLLIIADNNMVHYLLSDIAYNEGWMITTVDNTENAIAELHHADFAIIAVADGLPDTSMNALRKIIVLQQDDTLLVTQGGNSNSAFLKELQDAMQQSVSVQKTTYRFNDNALSNIGLNLNIQ